MEDIELIKKIEDYKGGGRRRMEKGRYKVKEEWRMDDIKFPKKMEH